MLFFLRLEACIPIKSGQKSKVEFFAQFYCLKVIFVDTCTHMYINSGIIRFRHPIQILKEALWNGKIAYILSDYFFFNLKANKLQ